MSPARRRRWPWLLLVVFVVVPLVEIYVIVQVGRVIGPWWTILLLIADSILGGWLIKHEGGRAWRSLTTALSEGRMPATEIADGALIVLGGSLMLAPGFVTDVIGILLVLPVTRPLFRALLAGAVARRVLASGTAYPTPDTHASPGGPTGPVVPGEVVDPPDSAR